MSTKISFFSILLFWPRGWIGLQWIAYIHYLKYLLNIFFMIFMWPNIFLFYSVRHWYTAVFVTLNKSPVIVSALWIITADHVYARHAEAWLDIQKRKKRQMAAARKKWKKEEGNRSTVRTSSYYSIIIVHFIFIIPFFFHHTSSYY